MGKISITGLDRPLRLQEVEDPTVSRHSAHEGGKVISPTYRPPLSPGEIPGTHFCQRLSSTSGHSVADRKDEVTEKSHGPHRKSKPRPSGL